jgi:hypothetical protein
VDVFSLDASLIVVSGEVCKLKINKIATGGANKYFINRVFTKFYFLLSNNWSKYCPRAFFQSGSAISRTSIALKTVKK